MIRHFLPLIFFIVAACTSITSLKLDERFGPSDPARFDRPSQSAVGAPNYWHDVRPVLDRRCVTCHACYDAPCQLNLTSYAGLARGATEREVYASARILPENPTRLGIDAQTTVGWRQLGFFPVLNERHQSSEANRVASVMHRMLTMKQIDASQTDGSISDGDLDFSINRSQVCVPIEGMEEYARSHPRRGMPFGLPALSTNEHGMLTRWIEAGAPYSPPNPPPAVVQRQVDDWERFLNGNDLKSQLSARYIYEHWFLGHLWFAERPDIYFELVRSRTPPGQPIDLIATRRPFDDPGVPRVWYRLRLVEATKVAKTHMPLQLDANRLDKLRLWFLQPEYSIKELPGYKPEIASNPFVTFRALPLDARYRLMLEDAQFTLSGFMKSPVCRGQVALNSINDHFWVFFVAPNAKESRLMEKMIDAALPTMRLPAEHESTAGLLAWQSYAELEQKYLNKKRAVVKSLGKRGVSPTFSDIWDGDGKNANAALTVFRHFDSASVEQGLIGDRPQTAFVMGYPLLERMHYLLTAGFDVYGNLGHQLATRLYMDFLRMESELNFIALLPIKDRQKVLDHWYRGRSKPHNRYFAEASAHFPEETGINFSSQDTLNELYGLLRQHVAAARDPYTELHTSGLAKKDVATLQNLSGLMGLAASAMPEVSLLRITDEKGISTVISLIRHSSHTNVAELFNEEERRRPDEDRLSAINGIIGAYPNAIFSISSRELVNFENAVRKLRGASDFKALFAKYGVSRTNRDFWAISDAIHDRWRADRPTEFGILDYSRLENF